MPVTASKALPPELVSLIHHVELNQHGWWDKALQRLVLATLWSSGQNLTPQQIATAINSDFCARVGADKLRSPIELLTAAGTLIALPTGELKISERALRSFKEQLEETTAIESSVSVQFTGILKRCCPSLNPEETWQAFHDQLLLPMLREMGARTYDLISGAGVPLDRAESFRSFLERYPADVRLSLRDAVIAFLDPKNGEVRSYVLRHLNAFFFVEASNLTGAAVEALTQSKDQIAAFTVFVDTNFLFSILALHENPSNEAAQALMELMRQLSGKVTVRLYLLPPTLDEARRVIRFNQESLGSFDLTQNLVDAGLQAGVSGITLKFLQESKKAGRVLKAEDYFGPYLENLVYVVRSKGLELYNENPQNLERLKTSQPVIDDIMQQLKWEEGRFKGKSKSYEALEHDMVLWHFVKSKRPANVDSPLQAKFWITTVDYHLLGFDGFKRRDAAGQIPICFHPATLIQMLQLWLPRSPQFEEAVLSSLRLPFLLADFDPETERVTVRILQILARFEGVSDLSSETIRSTLVNQVLRQKMAAETTTEKQIQLVREALIEEDKKLRATLDAKQKSIEQTQGELSQERGARQALEDRVKALEKCEREKELREQERGVARRFLSRWVVVPFVTVLLLGGATGFSIRHYGKWQSLRLVLWGLLTSAITVWVWVVDKKGMNDPIVSGRPVFAKFHRFKRGLFVLLLGVLASFIASALWDCVKGPPGSR